MGKMASNMFLSLKYYLECFIGNESIISCHSDTVISYQLINSSYKNMHSSFSVFNHI